MRRPPSQIALWRTVEAAAPKLYLRASEGATASEVPVADLAWHLHVPEGYRLTPHRRHGAHQSARSPSSAAGPRRRDALHARRRRRRRLPARRPGCVARQSRAQAARTRATQSAPSPYYMDDDVTILCTGSAISRSRRGRHGDCSCRRKARDLQTHFVAVTENAGGDAGPE